MKPKKDTQKLQQNSENASISTGPSGQPTYMRSSVNGLKYGKPGDKMRGILTNLAFLLFLIFMISIFLMSDKYIELFNSILGISNAK